MVEILYEKLSSEDKNLVDAAEKALENSYNPYNSKMKVAAAVRTVSGEIITGASYANDCSPSNICAERAVIITANSQGKRELSAMAIIGMRDGGIKNPVTPCGSCRQVMQEAVKISGRDLSVVCSNSDKTKILLTSLSELFPLPYGK